MSRQPKLTRGAGLRADAHTIIKKFAGPLAQGVLDLVFAFLGSLYDPSAREKDAALGGIR